MAVLWFQLVLEILAPDGNPVLIHLRWAQHADLLLVADSKQTSEPNGIGVSLKFAMTQDSVGDLAARIVSRGGTIAGGLVDQPWNAREIIVLVSLLISSFTLVRPMSGWGRLGLFIPKLFAATYIVF